MPSKTYYVAFDTKDMAPRVKATTVTLGHEVIRDMNAELPVNLCHHPLYAELERYVLANPSRPKAPA